MLQLPNLVTYPYLQDNYSYPIKLYWEHHGQKLWCHNLYFKNSFLRRPTVANFDDFTKIATMFIKAAFQDLKKLKELEKYVYVKKFLVSGEKVLM